MADISSKLIFEKKIIEGYGDGGFRISGQKITGSVIVTVKETILWDVNDVCDIDSDELLKNFARVENIRTLLIGTGSVSVYPDKGLIRHIKSLGMGVEFMDTGAACRTFNVLIEENREVIAALISL